MIITKTKQLSLRNRKHYPMTIKKKKTSIDFLNIYYVPDSIVITYLTSFYPKNL